MVGSVHGRDPGVPLLREAARHAALGTPPYYTKVEWEVTYREAVGSFLTETLPDIEEAARAVGVENVLDDVRLCFFFDN